MQTLEEIKVELRKGRIRPASVNRLFNVIEEQEATIKELKEKARIKSYMDMAKENLELEEALNLTREQRDYYKEKYESSLIRSG